MSVHHEDRIEPEQVIALNNPMIIKQFDRQEKPLIKLTTPLIIQKIEPNFGENQFKANAGNNPKSGKKYKSLPKLEDESIDPKKSKIKQKKKNRTKLYIGEEENFNEIKDDYYRPGSNPSLSLSIARPNQPEAITEAKKHNKKIKKKINYKSSKKQTIQKQVKYIESPSEIILNSAISIHDLAELTNISHEEIIKFLFLQGTIVNINQIVNLETATLILTNFNIKINNNIEIKKEDKNQVSENEVENKDSTNLIIRAPIVTIMGHVDHGKTTLLDAIKNSEEKVTDNEAGGITQAIGTYEILVHYKSQENKVVFLDTPGHEAFIAMRARGAQLADIAILIIAADDGIKPQTKEALKYIQKSKLAMIVAITKIDKKDSKVDTIKEELAKYNVVTEEWGGNTPIVSVSAISGSNIEQLIEKILILANIQDLRANDKGPAEGTIIDSYIDKTQGHIATLLVQKGQLNISDIMVCGNVIGKVRTIINTTQRRMQSCGPSSIVKVSGFSGIANIGEKFSVFSSEKIAKKQIGLLEQTQSESIHRQTKNNYLPLEYGINTANKKIEVILKTSTQGALESLLYSIKNIPQEKIQIEILAASSGAVTENDVNLAVSTNARLIAFKVDTNSGAKSIASKYKVEIEHYNVIYNLIEDLEEKMISMLEPEYLENEIGSGEIKATFNLSRGVIAGCYVISGKLKKDTLIKVYSNNIVIYQGSLSSIKKVKKDVNEMEAKQECGLFIEGFQDWENGNLVKCFELIEQKQKL